MGVMVNDPVAAADRQSQTDITAQGACPLTRTDIQLIPVRYAYADAPAEHPALKPGYDLEFQPMGIRQIRDGYLYLFHSEAPDVLHEYQVSDGGAVSKRLWTGDEAARDQRTGTPDTPAIVVPRRGYIDVLFSERQLTAKKCSMLIGWRSYRAKVMRRVSLSGFCPIEGNAQLLTKPDLEQLLAHPDAFEVPMDGTSHLAPWYWSQDTLDGALEPFAHRMAAYELDHAYLVVDDLMGHISDLLDAWAIVDTNHSAWLEKEDVRYYPARLITDLIRLDGARVGEIADAFARQTNDENTRAVYSKIAQASNQQKAELKRLVDDFPEYRYSAQTFGGPTSYSFMPADRERVVAMKEAVRTLAGELALESGTLLEAIEALADYQEHLVEGSTFTGQQGIADLVRLDEMKAYLENSEQQLSWFAEEKRRIVADLQRLLENFYLQGHLYDRASEKEYAALLGMDNALITVLLEWSNANEDFRFLKRFYFEGIGHQHLLALDLKPGIVPGTARDLINSLKSLLDANRGPKAYREWVELVDNSPYFQFPELAPGAAEQLSHHLAQKNIVARLALFELVAEVDAADLHGRLKQLFQRMPPGLQAHLFDNQRLYQVDLDIADTDSLKRHDALVREIEQLAQKHEATLAHEKRLEQRYRQANTRARREYKRTYDAEIRQARAQRQMLATQLRERSALLMDTSPIQGDNHSGAILISGLTRTSYGRAVQSELEELKRLQARGGLTRVLDYGRGMLHRQDALELPKRIGGLGLVSFVGMVSAVGAWDALQKLRASDLDNSVPDVVSGVAGTIGAAASVLTIVGSARLNYYYQKVSQVDVVLSRLARVNVWGGTLAAWGGFFSALADAKKQFDVLIGEDQSGKKLGSAITLLGDSAIVYGSGRMAFQGSRGLYHILLKKTKDVTWKIVNDGMLSIAGGVFRGLNAYLWVGTILVCLGNWVQNYFLRTKLQRWCEQSAWGKTNQGWPSDRQRYELVKAIYQPTLLVQAQQKALDGSTSFCSFRIELPALSKLQRDNLEWVVLLKRGGEWYPDHEHWNAAVLPKSLGAAGMALEISFGASELEQTEGVYLAFRYKPSNAVSWLPDPDKAFHYKLMLHEGGNLPTVAANEEMAWQPVGALREPDAGLAPLLSTYSFHPLIDVSEGSC